MPKQAQAKEAIDHSQKIAQHWKAISDPPVRPSKDEVAIYKKWFKKLTKNKKLKTLVFGATPELRDLALECNQDVTSVDISWEMLNAMNLLMKEDWKKEIILKCDWLKMPLKDNYYDIAMGDNYINMLRWRQFKSMIKETHRLLKPGGHLLTAVLIYSKVSDSIEEITRQYEKGQFRIGDLLAFSMDATYNPKIKETSVPRHFKELDRLFKLGKVSKKTMKNLEPYRGPLTIAKPTEREFEKLIKPYFKIVSKEYGADYKCCRYRPIYVLKAK
jgi:SAM-dependent methyltransferase